jgi:hypothetical protein
VGILDPSLGIKIFQVALEIFPRTVEGPGPKFFKVSCDDIAKLQITHRKKTHDDVLFLAVVGLKKEGIRFWMPTVVLQKKLPIVCRQLVADVCFEGRDLRVGSWTGG